MSSQVNHDSEEQHTPSSGLTPGVSRRRPPGLSAWTWESLGAVAPRSRRMLAAGRRVAMLLLVAVVTSLMAGVTWGFFGGTSAATFSISTGIWDTPTPTPPAAQSVCTQSGACFTADVLGHYTSQCCCPECEDVTLIGLRITNACAAPMDYVDFGGPGLTPVLPWPDTYYPGLGWAWYRVSWPTDDVLGTPAIRFTPVDAGISSGASDVFLFMVQGFDPDAPLWVEMAAGETVERFGFTLNNPDCASFFSDPGTCIRASARAAAYCSLPTSGGQDPSVASLTTTEERYGVRGEVCVTNDGEIPTMQLRVDLRLEMRTADGEAEFTEVPGATLSLYPGDLPAGESLCVPYDLPVPAMAGAEYRVATTVTIMDHLDHLADAFGPSAVAAFALDGLWPIDPTLPPPVSTPAPVETLPVPEATPQPTVEATTEPTATLVPEPTATATLPPPASTLPAPIGTLPPPVVTLPPPEATLPAPLETLPAPPPTATPSPSPSPTTAPEPTRQPTSLPPPAEPPVTPTSVTLPPPSGTLPAPVDTLPAPSETIPAPDPSPTSSTATLPPPEATLPPAETLPAPESTLPASATMAPPPP